MAKKTINSGNQNGLISEKQFRELANVHERYCISIFIPTFRAGEDVDSRKGQLRLKNRLKELKKKLQELELSENEIKKMIAPLQPFLEDVHFWRNQSDGLAIFLTNDQLEYFTLPVHFDEITYVADHFYLIPVFPLFNDDGKFYLLALSLQKIDFYECSRHFITEVYVEDLTPERLEDAVGYDYRDKSLQFRSPQGGSTGALFHGHGSGKEDKLQETEKFFRAVDEGLMNLLNDEKAPLVLACVDHYFPIYKKVTRYTNLFEKNVSGNPEEVDPVFLHEKAWSLVEDFFKQERKQKKENYNRNSDNEKTLDQLEEILPASFDGRIDTLFIQKGKDKFGTYHEGNRQVQVDKDPSVYSDSLFNLAVIHTLKNNGNVYLEEEENMPTKGHEINALLRF
jgi:hypothetical protein